MHHAITKCARRSTASNGSSMPASARGATTRLTSGIASAFATGEMSDTCWKSARRSGSSATVTAAWVRVHPASQPGCETRFTITKRMAATAPKESQKPAEVTAHGSRSSTISSAAASTTEALAGTPLHSASATTHTMYSVRCAGTAKPASSV
jgi:hypothetical protein